MTNPDPPYYTLPVKSIYVVDDHRLTKRQQVALAVLPTSIDWNGYRYDLAVKDAYKIADMFLDEQS
jgi:hypothetical protein